MSYDFSQKTADQVLADFSAAMSKCVADGLAAIVSGGSIIVQIPVPVSRIYIKATISKDSFVPHDVET